LQACMLTESAVAEIQPPAFYASTDTALTYRVFCSRCTSSLLHSYLSSAINSFQHTYHKNLSSIKFCTSRISASQNPPYLAARRSGHAPSRFRLPHTAFGGGQRSLRRYFFSFPLLYTVLRHFRDLDSLATIQILLLAHLLLNSMLILLYTLHISLATPLPPTNSQLRFPSTLAIRRQSTSSRIRIRPLFLRVVSTIFSHRSRRVQKN
jgi:hypothetical protein